MPGNAQNLISHFQSLLTLRKRAAKVGAIGMTLSSESIQLLQMEDKGDGPVIRSAISIRYPCPRSELLADQAIFRKFVKIALRAGKFVGNRVVTCLIPQDVRHIPIQYRQQEKNPSSYEPFFKELQSHIQAPLANFVIDVLHIRTPGSDAAERSAIAVVASKERTIAHLELLRLAGLDVLALDTGPAALARVISDAHYNQQGDSSSALILNFGKDFTYLTALWGRRLILNRELAFGENILLRKICQRLKCDMPTAAKLLFNTTLKTGSSEEIAATIREILHHELIDLTREIGQSLSYVASLTRGDTAKIIYLMGGVSSYPGIKEVIESQIQIPVAIYDPAIQFPHWPGIFPLPEGFHHLLATATGLALRGLYPDGN